jgi:hypothetical protein
MQNESTGDRKAISDHLYTELLRLSYPELAEGAETDAPGFRRVVVVPDNVYRAQERQIARRHKRNKIGAASRARQRAAR